MNLFDIMQISGTGLTAQRAKIGTVTENLANAETTRTPEGGPYRRKMVVFEAAPLKSNFKDTLADKRSQPEGVRVAQIVSSQQDFRIVHDPSNPDADPKTGNVKMPNVDPLTEMSDLIVAKRTYDANVTAMNNTKAMILEALQIGK